MPSTHDTFGVLNRYPPLPLLHKNDEAQYGHHENTRISTKKIPISPVDTSLKVFVMATGSLATIPAKMIREIPLPIPRSVICSPSHMMKAVPAVSVMTVMMRNVQPGCDDHGRSPGGGHALKPDADTEPLDDAEHNGPVTGILGNLFSPLLAFLGKLLQMRNDHRQKLNDDRGADVRHDPQCKDGQSFERATREHVEKPQQRPLCAGKKRRQSNRVDPRRRDMHTDAIDRHAARR